MFKFVPRERLSIYLYMMSFCDDRLYLTISFSGDRKKMPFCDGDDLVKMLVLLFIFVSISSLFFYLRVVTNGVTFIPLLWINPYFGFICLTNPNFQDFDSNLTATFAAITVTITITITVTVLFVNFVNAVWRLFILIDVGLILVIASFCLVFIVKILKRSRLRQFSHLNIPCKLSFVIIIIIITVVLSMSFAFSFFFFKIYNSGMYVCIKNFINFSISLTS